MLVRITDNPEVPEQYRTGKIYEDEHGVYIDVILFDRGKRDDGEKNLTAYGTFALLVKDGRVRIELRDVYCMGDTEKACTKKATLDDYIACMKKVDDGKAEWMRGHVKNKHIDVSAEYKAFIADANNRLDDENEIGNNW